MPFPKITRKLTTLLLTTLIPYSLFLIPNTAAQSQSTLTCPVTEFTYTDKQTGETKSINDIRRCQGEEFETILAGIFLAERDRTSTQINRAYHDNALPVTDVARLAIQDIRESNTCYLNLCSQVVNKCKSLGQDSTQRSAIDRQTQCLDIARQFSQAQETEFTLAVNHNTHRKALSLNRETFRAIEGNLRTFVVNVLNRIGNNLRELNSKITNFIGNPV